MCADETRGNHSQRITDKYMYILKKERTKFLPLVSPVNVHDDDFGKLRYTCTCSSFIHLVGGVKYLAYNIKDFSLCFRYMQWRKQRGRMHSLKWYAGDRPTGWELHQAKKGDEKFWWSTRILSMKNWSEFNHNSYQCMCGFRIFFPGTGFFIFTPPPSIFSVPK